MLALQYENFVNETLPRLGTKKSKIYETSGIYFSRKKKQ